MKASRCNIVSLPTDSGEVERVSGKARDLDEDPLYAHFRHAQVQSPCGTNATLPAGGIECHVSGLVHSQRGRSCTGRNRVRLESVGVSLTFSYL